jgi:hypothetical protein
MTDFINYFEAMKILTQNLDMKPFREELWMWCFIGNECEGLDAYFPKLEFESTLNNESLELINKWEQYNFVGFGDVSLDINLVERAFTIEKLFFLREDIEAFKPSIRFISGKDLLQLWAKKLGDIEEAKRIINQYSERYITFNCPEDMNAPKLTNYYYAAVANKLSENDGDWEHFEYPDKINHTDEERNHWEQGLGGIYSLNDVHTIERFRDMGGQQPLVAANARKVILREGGYKRRDEFAMNEVINNPKMLLMRAGEIKKILQKISKLFTSGYSDWWRNNPIFDKSSPGRNPK